jgi:hypothetical protein
MPNGRPRCVSSVRLHLLAEAVGANPPGRCVCPLCASFLSNDKHFLRFYEKKISFAIANALKRTRGSRRHPAASHVTDFECRV